MLLRLCILQYIVNFPGSWRNFRRPLDAAQTVYFTISLTAMQREAALDHLYGAKPPSGSSSSGGFKGGATISEMERLPQGGVRRGVRRVNRGVRSPKPTQAPIGNFSGPFFEVRLVMFICGVPLCRYLCSLGEAGWGANTY